MSLDLDTERGMRAAIDWTEQMMSCLKDGGQRYVPRSGTRVTLTGLKRCRITKGWASDSSIRRVFIAAGWAVEDAIEEQI